VLGNIDVTNLNSDLANISGNLTAGNIDISGTGEFDTVIVSALANVISTTAATSTTTGALTVAGGVGIAGNVYANNVYGGTVYKGGFEVLNTEDTIDGGTY